MIVVHSYVHMSHMEFKYVFTTFTVSTFLIKYRYIHTASRIYSLQPNNHFIIVGLMEHFNYLTFFTFQSIKNIVHN